MTHTYNISGMTCSGCQQKVTQLLLGVAGIHAVEVDLKEGTAVIGMDHHLKTETLQSAFENHPKFRLSTGPGTPPAAAHLSGEELRIPFLKVYRPILLIFGYLLVICFIPLMDGHNFDPMLAMRIFMAGFFLVFSFFKFLDLDGFAESYAMYDLVARQFKEWGYVYAAIELILGLAYAVNFQPFITNLVTLAIMTIGLAGVLKSVLAKRKIRCACLGTVFNLPMSTVTIIEDTLMIAMSAIMLLTTIG